MEDAVKVYSFGLPLGTMSIQSNIDLDPFAVFCIEEWHYTAEHPEGTLTRNLFLRINDYVLFEVSEDGEGAYVDNTPLLLVGEWSKTTIYKCTIEEQRLISTVFKKCAYTKAYIEQYNKVVDELKNSGCKVNDMYINYEEDLDYGEQI